MSNLWINWRFGTRHLQIGSVFPYVSFNINPYWVEHKPAKWFEVYK